MIVRDEDNRVDKLLMKKYIREIEDVVNFIGGLDDIKKYVALLEKSFAGYIGTKHAFAVASGTDALHLSLLAAGVGKGDSVIVPNLTYPSTAVVVRYAGATPIIVDVKEDTLGMDENLLEDSIRGDTKAIMPVHMFGHPCNMKSIMGIAKKHGLKVVEDSCQATGSELGGQKTGSFGDINAFSFSHYKPLSSLGGSGGMVTFNGGYEDVLKEHVNIWMGGEKLLDSGKKFNKMSFLDAATVTVKLRHIRIITKSKEKAKRVYDEVFEGVGGVEILKRIKNLCVMENYPIMVRSRDALAEYLKKNRVLYEMAYRPVHSLPAFSDLGYGKGSFPVTEKYSGTALHLPLFTFIKEDELLHVAELVKNFLKGRRGN